MSSVCSETILPIKLSLMITLRMAFQSVTVSPINKHAASRANLTAGGGFPIERISTKSFFLIDFTAEANSNTCLGPTFYYSRNYLVAEASSKALWEENNVVRQTTVNQLIFYFLPQKNDELRHDKTSKMRVPRLIWVFAGRTVTLLVLSCRGSDVHF